MKKNLWILGMAVAAFTSCTQSEVMDIPENRTISFDSFVGKGTRADIVNDDAFNDFIVYAAMGNKTNEVFVPDNTSEPYMNQVHVTRVDANKSWTYTPIKEWIINKYYRFAAYSDGHNTPVSNNSPTNEYQKVIFNPNFTPTVKVKNQDGTLTTQTIPNMWGLSFDDYEAGNKDLIAATSLERNTIGANTGHNSVNFSFVHALAKVQFKFSYFTEDASENTQVYIKPFNLEAIKTSDGNIFHYHDSGTEMTYVNWESQFATPQIASTTGDVNYSTGTYTYFPGTNHTVNSENIQATLMDPNEPIFYNNYVMPQCNNFNISGIQVLVYKNNVLSSQFLYNNVSLKIEGHEYWKPGYVYRYEANLNASKQYIEFTASVDNWIDTQDRDAIIGGSEEAEEDEEE